MKDNIKKLYKQIEDWLEEGDIEIPTFELMHHMIQVCDFHNQWKENGYENDPSNPETIDPDDLEDFKISAKKKFGSKTYANLSYKKSFSLTNPDQLQIGVEYKLNRNLSLVGNMDDKGNLHLKYRYRYAY